MNILIFKYRFILLFLISLISFSLIIIPMRLAIAHYQAPYPQAILTLGGKLEREIFTAQFAQINPYLDIWVSSGGLPEATLNIFQTTGVSKQRLHIDLRATDTVTNFTTLVADFKQKNIKHIYLITSSFHMPRAKAIATIVLGSQGITFTPIPVPSKEKFEPKIEILRDSCRSFFWLVTGRTGASLKKNLS